MRKGVLAVVATAALLSASGALAASPAGAGYGGQGGVQSDVAGAGGGSGLPFTGLDLTLLVIGSLLLVVVGVTLRRATRVN